MCGLNHRDHCSDYSITEYVYVVCISWQHCSHRIFPQELLMAKMIYEPLANVLWTCSHLLSPPLHHVHGRYSRQSQNFCKGNIVTTCLSPNLFVYGYPLVSLNQLCSNYHRIIHIILGKGNRLCNQNFCGKTMPTEKDCELSRLCIPFYLTYKNAA